MGKLLIILTAFCLSLNALAAKGFSIPGYELVLTSPTDTNLSNPDLRSPADVWVEMINGAKSQIDLEHMYAVSKAGEPLAAVISALREAGERGVKIRFLLEQKMLRASDPETIKELQAIKNMQLQIVEFGKIFQNDGINHSKFMVVDNKQAYVGSQNFDWRSLKHIHELGVRIEDEALVKQISSIFQADWQGALAVAKGKTSKPLRSISDAEKIKLSKPIYLVSSPLAFTPKNIPHSEFAIVKIINEAQKEILIQVMNYAPFDRKKNYYSLIDNAIRAAALRGVKVKLMVADWSTEKPHVDFLKSLSLVPNVEVKIISIPEAKEGFISFARVAHSKYMVVDGTTAWIGTSNWEGGYLNNLRNLELVFNDLRFAKRVAALHQQLWDSSYVKAIDLGKDYPKIIKDKSGKKD
jgi:phosphatidylserine/phosphatidylglycerophosphate/cardiolipin synthase-like enzyme